MASLKDLRDRIASVKATQKITKAMQMVAASKLRKAQEAVEAARPYSQRVSEMVNNLLSDLSNTDLPSFLQTPEKAEKYLLVVCSSERGLCGGFNSHIVRIAREKIKELLAAKKQIKIITIGKKGADMLRREYGHLMIDHVSLREVKIPSYKDGNDIAKNLLARFGNSEFDVCLLVYSKFKSVIQQIPTINQVIPADISSLVQQDTKKGTSNFECEPGVEAILNKVAQHNISTQIFNALLENNAGEMGAKMTAMDNATRNAGDMINKLSITYNRQRQAKITTELIEIISGAEAL